MQQASANCADNHKSGVSWLFNTLTSQFKQHWMGSNLPNSAEIVSSWAQRNNNTVSAISPPKCSTSWKKEKTPLKTCHPLYLTPSKQASKKKKRYHSSIRLLIRALNWDVKWHVLNTELLQSRRGLSMSLSPISSLKAEAQPETQMLRRTAWYQY